MSKRVRVKLISVFLVVALLTTMAFAAPVSAQCAESYRIRYGDTLGVIASFFDTTVTNLMNLNNIGNPNLIYAGNTLCVSQTDIPDPAPGAEYVVRYGDTLSQIAYAFGATIREIALVNGITNVDLIYAGEALVIPGLAQ